MLTLLTCTSDRPEAFALCERWMARQTFDGPVEWIVADDGQKPARCALGQRHIRRKPSASPVESFLGNMTEGLRAASGSAVACIEDDDWYSPTYLTDVAALLTRGQLVGQNLLRVYHVGLRHWRVFRARRFSSLCQTAFSRDLLPHVLSLVERHDRYNVDYALWRESGIPDAVKHLEFRLDNVVGIKGFAGRGGLSFSHQDWKVQTAFQSDAGDMLAEWIGDDAAVYRA